MGVSPATEALGAERPLGNPEDAYREEPETGPRAPGSRAVAERVEHACWLRRVQVQIVV